MEGATLTNMVKVGWGFGCVGRPTEGVTLTLLVKVWEERRTRFGWGAAGARPFARRRSILGRWRRRGARCIGLRVSPVSGVLR